MTAEPKPEPIPIDEQAILAAERYATGAFIHDIRQVICIYRNYCNKGNVAGAEKYKRRMYLLAIEAQQSYYNEICQACGGFKYKCDQFGHIPAQKEQP